MTAGQFSCLNQIPKYNDLAQLSVSLGLHFWLCIMAWGGVGFQIPLQCGGYGNHYS